MPSDVGDGDLIVAEGGPGARVDPCFWRHPWTAHPQAVHSACFAEPSVSDSSPK
jgi:hypothetical protein